MPHTDTSKSQAVNRTCYNASNRYHQITGSKSYILPCLTQIPANHRQQVVLLTMLHTDTSKSQATNRPSYHASHRYKQITGNQSYILPCLTQTPANHRQQIVHLTMPLTDTSKSQATNRTFYNATYRYQQITGHLANKSYILPCLTLIPANHSQQVVLLALPHTDTRKVTGNKSYILPCLTQTPANHRQQIVHLTMPHTDTSKSQATNRTSCHASHRYLQITGNKSCFLPANHRQLIVHLTMPHTDTSKSQATNRTSDHASHRYQQITGNKSYIPPCLTQIPANHRQQIVHLTMLHTDTRKSQTILPTNRASCHASC